MCLSVIMLIVVYGECSVYFVGVVMEGCVVSNGDRRGHFIVMVETKIFVELHFN